MAFQALHPGSPSPPAVGRRNYRRGQQIATWADPLPLRWADRSTPVHAQGKISAPCFFCENFSATPCQLMFRHANCRRLLATEKPDVAAWR